VEQNSGKQLALMLVLMVSAAVRMNARGSIMVDHGVRTRGNVLMCMRIHGGNGTE